MKEDLVLEKVVFDAVSTSMSNVTFFLKTNPAVIFLNFAVFSLKMIP